MISSSFLFFFFNDTATTEIYTLSLHDALPISVWILYQTCSGVGKANCKITDIDWLRNLPLPPRSFGLVRSEEHTSELQSRLHLVCRLLLEKKKKKKQYIQRQRIYHINE